MDIQIESPKVTNFSGGKVRQYSFGGVPFMQQCPAINLAVSVKFAPGNSGNYEIPYLQATGTVDFDAAIITGASSASFYLNGSLVTGTVGVSQGQTLRIVIVKTSPEASVGLAIQLAPSAILLSHPGYEWAIWGNTANATPLKFEYYANANALAGGVTGAAFNKSAASTQTWQGASSLVYEPDELGAFFGLNNQPTVTFPSQHYFRDKHAIFVTTNSFSAYEFGVFQAFFPTTESGVYLYRIRDTGTSVLYEYSTNKGASYLLFHTSSASYTPNTTWRASAVLQFDNAKIKGVQIWKSF